jgi:hypothetical protein
MTNQEQAGPSTPEEETKCTPEIADILSRFSSHRADEDGVKRMRAIRATVRKLALVIQGLCPDGREKATALTQLSHVMMSANSAIAQQFPVDPAEFE